MEVTGRQLPLFVDVSVKGTVPERISEALGWYIAFNAAADGVNVPVPGVVHVPLNVPLAVALKVYVLELHMVAVPPVLSTGAGVMVTTTVSASVPHFPLLIVVTMSETVPSALSASEGE